MIEEGCNPTDDSLASTAAPDVPKPTIVPLGERPGDWIGSFKLLEPIGEGGFGIVFVAEQEHPVRRRVALKVIKLGMDTREVIARFEAERQALALMDHPNIAKIFDGGATAMGRPYFAMELVRGLPVTQYADKHKLNTNQRVALAAQICRAVQHAHGKGIIHRDLKPSNVLVMNIDDKPVPKVIDFGIAKATQSRLTDRTLFTGFRQMIGTPQYMSPEQADSEGVDVDTRTDIYSLGVLLYELLVGTTPMDGSKFRHAAFEVMRMMICDSEVPHPATRLHTLGDQAVSTIATNRGTDTRRLRQILLGELDWIVMKALEKDRSRRYDTASALAEDLTRYLAGDAVLAGPVSGFYRLKKTIRRYKAAAIIGTIMGFCLLAGVIGTSWGLIRARANERRAIDAERRALSQEKIVETEKREALNQKSRADIRTEEANHTLEFFTDLIAGASPRNTKDGRISQVLIDAMIDPALKTIDRRFKDQPLVQASIRVAFVRTLLDLGRPELAQVQAKKAWDLRQEILGDNNSDTRTAADLYGRALDDQGHHVEAGQIFKMLWDSCRTDLGDDNAETLTMLNNYASSILLQGRYDEAELLFKRCLDGQQRTQKPGTRDDAIDLSNYAAAVNALGRHAQAEGLFRQVWQIRLRLLGEDDPDTIVALNNLSVAVFGQHRYADAEGLFKQVWEARTRVLGANHPSTLWAMSSYARSIDFEGRHGEAEGLFKQILETRRKLQGETSPDTLVALTYYAATLDEEGHHVEAEPMLRNSANTFRELHSDDSDLVSVLNTFGKCLLAQQKWSEAEAIFRESSSLELVHRGASAANTSESQELLNQCLTAEGKSIEAATAPSHVQ